MNGVKKLKGEILEEDNEEIRKVREELDIMKGVGIIALVAICIVGIVGAFCFSPFLGFIVLLGILDIGPLGRS